MNADQKRLARRAIACAGWRWLPGMLTEDGTRLGARLPDRMLEALEVLPDLSDAATLGGLLSLVCHLGPPEVEALVEGLERVGRAKGGPDEPI